MPDRVSGNTIGGLGSSSIVQNFDSECERAINQQIKFEYLAWSLYAYFSRFDVAFPGAAGFFWKSAEEELGHAKQWIDYQNKRGGVVKFYSSRYDLSRSVVTLQDAFREALECEKLINERLLELNELAGRKSDTQLCDFIESNFLGEQIDSIKQLGDYITQLERIGDSGHGQMYFDDRLNG